MAPRRSARLRGSTPAVEEPNTVATPVKKLPSVMEHDETPDIALPPSTGTGLSEKTSPLSQVKPSIKTPTVTPIKTPTMGGSFRPAHEEMHPSKVHQSTTKHPDPGLVLGFSAIKRDSSGKIVKESILQNTPTKVRGSPATKLGTPSFDFKFSCEDSQLSQEARKLMDNVREDVARIKAQMILEKGEQERKEREADQLHTGRKIAKPRGKTGRFSGVHMAEFRKMDSIAGHPSAFRAQAGRFRPVDVSLKRKGSKASLDESEKTPSPTKPITALAHSSKIPTVNSAKRVKRSNDDDVSAIRRGNEDVASCQPAVKKQPKTTVRRFPLTPTRFSIARSSSEKLLKISMMPSLLESAASKIPTTPRTPQTDFNPKFKTNPPTLGNLKSILRRHQPLFSDDPLKIVAGTHIATPGFNPDINLKDLPSISFGDDAVQTPSPKKRVEFTPNTNARYELAQSSPSPLKVDVVDVVYPTLPTMMSPNEEDPNLLFASHPSPSARNPAISTRQSSPFPNLPAVPHGLVNKKRRREEVDGKDENIPPTDSASDERSSKRPKTNGPAAIKAVTTTPIKSHSSTSVTREKRTPGRNDTPGSILRKSRGVLSLSRLNMLAKPRIRH
ncbi:hypothetical protein V8E54_004934 [Elaphomyces granulatus]